jgi:tRNA (cmo5U34)-methyltransferase
MKVPADWTFKNAEVANAFETHVREQLPWYDLATGAVVHLARHYLPHNGLLYDIGASTGNIGRALEDVLKVRKARLIAIEESEEMAKIYNAPGTLVVANALDYEYEPADVSILFLVLMFMPIDKRKDYLQLLINNTKPGGCVIIVDKIHSPSGYLSNVLHRMTIAGKVATGVSPKEIIEKELSLGGIQRPLPESFVSFLAPAGKCFFRFGEFAAWIIEKPE